MAAAPDRRFHVASLPLCWEWTASPAAAHAGFQPWKRFASVSHIGSAWSCCTVGAGRHRLPHDGGRLPQRGEQLRVGVLLHGHAHVLAFASI